MDFFKLTTPQMEDKVITSQKRIYDDVITFGKDNQYSISTTSKADKLKIRFFLDVIRIITYDDDYDIDENPEAYNEGYYRYGKWIEAEDEQEIQLFTSIGFCSVKYICDKISTGNFNFNFEFEDRGSGEPGGMDFWLYISSISFEDSFYDSSKGWLNDGNPNKIPVEVIKELNPGVPPIEDLDYFLIAEENGAEWKSPIEAQELLPVTIAPTDTEPGVKGSVIVDNETILVDGTGIISVNIDGVTVVYDDVDKKVKVDYTTIPVDNDTIKYDAVDETFYTDYTTIPVDNVTIKYDSTTEKFFTDFTTLNATIQSLSDRITALETA